jgi:hypothetical protein
MKDLLNFFDKPKDPISVEAVSIRMASPDTIREWSYGEVKSQKPSTIELLSLKKMVCSVQRFLVQSKTTNVFVENTKE